MRAPSRRRTKKCFGKHAELIPTAKYVLRPAGTREYRQTTQQYPRFLQTCCRDATRYLRLDRQSRRNWPCGQSIVYQWEISASKGGDGSGPRDDTGIRSTWRRRRLAAPSHVGTLLHQDLYIKTCIRS